ncbi:MAG: tetratricopeptide repeat protein [Planctomycetota bacterium]|jgi:tetratricopeptide (TPR) repeat protein
MNKPLGKYWYLLICIFLILATFAAYWPVLKCEFVKYDDDKYVTDNHQVKSGLSWQGVRWAFTTGHASNWHPVTWLSHMADCKLFGLQAGAHHLTNLLLHIANTLLLFSVLKRMTGALWPSAFVAAVFGLHPLHIESVAWVAERKDVLSTFFWMLTMWAYVLYAERPGVGRYLLTLVLFVLGLMAKPMLVTLPFVLLLLDYWPLERIRLSRHEGNGELQNTNEQNTHRQKPILHLLFEKVPFFVISAISSVVTVFVQRIGGAVPTMEAMGIKVRIGNAVVSYIGYIEKMLWPSGLAVLYPHPAGSLSMTKAMVCGLLLVLISICLIYFGLRRRYLAVGWLWYIGTLVPVIGLVQVGGQAMADRYTYIPLTGLFIIIAWGASELVAGWRYRKVVATTLAVVVLTAAVGSTRLQLRHWQNSLTLFKRTLDVTSKNWLIHNNYANVLKETGRVDEAIEHFHKSLRIKPKSAEIHNNLGSALDKLGRVDEAIEHYKKALKLKPRFSEAHYNLATVLSKQGKIDEAIAEYREALRLKPRDVDALNNLGFALAEQGNFNGAIKHYRKALGLEPENIIAHGRLGLALAAVGKLDEAVKEFRIVLSAQPDDAEMHFNVGVILERQGKVGEAIEKYQQALEINPDYTQASEQLRAALEKQ